MTSMQVFSSVVSTSRGSTDGNAKAIRVPVTSCVLRETGQKMPPTPPCDRQAIARRFRAAHYDVKVSWRG